MPVYYSAISRGRIVVCDYSTVKVQLESYALRALELLGPSDEQRRQEIDGRLIFTLVLGKLTYLAITDMDYPREDAFRFLESVHRELKSCGLNKKALSCAHFALRADFQEQLGRLTIDACGDSRLQLKDKVEGVQNLMRQNVNKVAERGEALASLEERSEYLEQNSTDFQRTATKLKRKMMCGSIKLWVVLIIIILLIVGVIVTLIVLAATKKI